jgi:hypothetical protein
MIDMKSSSVTRLAEYDSRVSRAMAARRRLLRNAERRAGDEVRGGRAWLNGRELGGTEPRLAHLAGSFD